MILQVRQNIVQVNIAVDWMGLSVAGSSQILSSGRQYCKHKVAVLTFP